MEGVLGWLGDRIISYSGFLAGVGVCACLYWLFRGHQPSGWLGIAGLVGLAVLVIFTATLIFFAFFASVDWSGLGK
jgi:hypothetical protein